MGRRHKKGRRLHGILLLDKVTAVSSNHALQRIKRLYDASKAGHTGSLDPLATGMLPVCFGEATKISAFLLDADKTYLTDARLGVRTNSGDADGEVIETLPLPGHLSSTSIAETVRRFTGTQEQIPPMYSAIKIDGQRLYKLARQGLSVERPARKVTIFSIDILAWEGDLLRLQVRCSKGTYIRTLVEDIGTALGCGAHVETLRRVAVAPFESQPMVTQSTLEQCLEKEGLAKLDSFLLSADCALVSMSRCEVDATEAAMFRHGQNVPGSGCTRCDGQQYVKVYCGDQLLGIGRPTRSSIEGQPEIRPYRVFNW